jgi:putative nucleotidyltransferase with HDIG domain
VNQAARRRSSLLRAYVATVFVIGLAAIVEALFSLHRSPVPPLWIGLALLAITSDSLRAFKIPGLTAHVSPSEIFLFVIVLLFGSAPAVVTLAVGGLTFSLRRERTRKDKPSRFQYQYAAFDLAEPALSISVAAHVYFWVGGLEPLWTETASVARIAWPALAMTGVYFLLNSGLSALAEAGATGTSPFALWRKYFKDVFVNYVSNASVAVVLAANLPTRDVVEGLQALAATAMDLLRLLPSLAVPDGLTALWLVNPFTIAGQALMTQAQPVLLVFASVLAVVIPLVIAPYRNLALSTGRLADQKKHLDEMEEQNLRLAEMLAMTAEEKDEATSLGHIRSVRKYTLWLAEEMGVTGQRELEDLSFASLLHDLGKLRIPDYIREKPTRLTESERRRMQTHAALGAEMAGRIGERFRTGVAPIIHRHHENWDGHGYPDGIAGEAIPLGARILQVADCYDALRRWRPYRRAWTHEEALTIVRERAGTMYDPAVVRAFDAIEARIAAEPYDDAAAVAVDATAHDDLAVRPADVPPPLIPDALRESGRSALTQLLDHLFRLDPHAGVDATCDIVSTYLRRLTPATLVVFYTHDVETEELVAAHASGYGAGLLRGSSMPLGKNVSGWVAVNGRSIITDPVLDAVESLSRVDPGFKSLMSVPLATDAATVGVVTLYATGENAFQDEQRQALELASAPIADTLARALEHDRSRLALFADEELAGVASRRALDELVARDRRKRVEQGRARAVLCLKNRGQRDVMLHAMMAVSHSTRIADLIFRPSDDSLVVLMKDADAAAEQLVTERIMAALPPGLLAPQSETSALRLGFACSPRDGEYWSDLLHAAQHRAWDLPGRSPAEPEPAATLTQRGLPWKA